MKKIIYILGSILCVLSITGCFNKKLTTDDFKNKMESLGYVVEIKGASGETSSEVEEVAIANKGNYEIKFYVLTNSGSAIEFSESMKQEWTNSTNYTDIKRKDNTLIVVNVPADYKENVKKDIKSLGY